MEIQLSHMPDPALPLDLERTIFEIAALSHSRIPKLMVEPLLYRVIMLRGYFPWFSEAAAENNKFPHCPAEVLLRIIETKPGFLQNHVQHLFLDHVTNVSITEIILSACNRVTNLFAGIRVSFADSLHVSIDVGDLLTLAPRGNFPFVLTITHLELLNMYDHFDETWNEGDTVYTGEELNVCLASMRHLPHVAFDYPPPYAKLSPSFSNQRIVCIVTLGADRNGNEPVGDERFVCIEPEPPTETNWLRGTEERDFRAVAEAFIAAKRTKRVDSSLYRISADDALWDS
ncbi:hypothetical protein DFH07DRAFT_777410 [Mycena maculata]|uniref:Uncharacterized protein n=1 Tax=Mycena maculata TaxID=230809 RepID=A0AAD7IKN4_9AGAR|nr:hypothetical protein DFH07DRAFT_777410 [Mycena maculata]